MNNDKFIKSVTFPLSLLISPVWLFDVDSLQVVWANASALRLCNVTEISELQRRNMAFDLSCKVRERLNKSDANPNSNNDTMSEFLTLYPDDQPVTYECSIGALATPAGGRWLMVNGIRHINQSGSEALYLSSALLHTSVCVSVYTLDGQLRYSNPAARAMLGNDAMALAERFYDTAEWQAVSKSLQMGDETRIEAKVATVAGYVWHSVTLEICPDPVMSESFILVTELDVSARRQAQEQVQQLAYHDALTGLPNRASWYQALNVMLESGKQPLSVLFMDLDGFKAVNDTYGHDVGDKLLIAVGMRISDCLDNDEFLARLGGDEFTLLMGDDCEGEASADKAQHILNSLATPIIIDGHEVSIAPSIGISRYPADAAEEADQIMQQADIAMYAAKNAGCGFVQFEAHMSKANQRRSSIVRDATLKRREKDNGKQARTDVAA